MAITKSGNTRNFNKCAADFNNELKLAFHSNNLTAQKMKFSVKDFFTKCDQIRKKLRIWSHLLKKSFFENFIFCAVSVEQEVSDDLSVWSLTYHVTL